jgi:hypothetical protein
LLSERGALITKGELHKIPALNLKIDLLIHEKKTELVRPVAAFITFEKQEGKDRALKYFVDPNKQSNEEANVDATQQ